MTLAGLPVQATAEVVVDRRFSTDVFKQQVYIPAGSYWTLALGSNEPGTVYSVQVDLGNAVYKDISAVVLDEGGLSQFRQGLSFRGQGKQKALAPFAFEASIPATGSYYLLLDNTYAKLIKKKAAVGVKKTFAWPEPLAVSVRTSLEQVYSGLRGVFEFQDFNIYIKPCGQVNAYSSGNGDITLCTELMSAFANKPGVFMGTLFHELGHTLPNLWGLPGVQNEDMADEFATVLLLRIRDGRERIEEWLSFFENRDAMKEARNMIRRGDTHSLSVQRIRNIRNHVSRAADLQLRWNRQLYPHMTDSALQQIAAASSAIESADLARAELAKRGR